MYGSPDFKLFVSDIPINIAARMREVTYKELFVALNRAATSNFFGFKFF